MDFVERTARGHRIIVRPFLYSSTVDTPFGTVVSKKVKSLPGEYRAALGYTTPPTERQSLVPMSGERASCGHIGFVDFGYNTRRDFVPIAANVGDRNYLIIHRLGIEPAFQRQGFATALVNTIEAYAAENGCCYVIGADFKPGPSVTLFEKLGYAFGESARVNELRRRGNSGIWAWKATGEWPR